MQIEQFVMAYGIDQDRIRALLPEGYESLRPVLRTNTEISDGKSVYIEFNTPVTHDGKRGWMNIANWEGEKDNDGCFFLKEKPSFRPAETINSNKEFCDCAFEWRFHEGDAKGKSIGKTLPAFLQESKTRYERGELTPENAAAIPCTQVLGSYIVRFDR